MYELLQKAELIDQEYVSHWHPNLTVNLVFDETNWIYGQVPQPLDECKFTDIFILYSMSMYNTPYCSSLRYTFLTWWKFLQANTIYE